MCHATYTTRSRKEWFYLWHGVCNTVLFMFSIGFIREYGLSETESKSYIPVIVENHTRMLLMFVGEVYWCLNIGQYSLATQHHLPALLFWWVGLSRAPFDLGLFFLREGQTIPVIILNTIPKLMGKSVPDVRIHISLRILFMLIVRFPLSMHFIGNCERLWEYAFMAFIVAYDTHIITQMIKKIFN